MAPEIAGHQYPRTLAVVLNYRTPDATIHAVKSLQASTRPPASVIVVDNASGDGSQERIQAATSGVEVIASASNDGFSAGCNAGIRAALARGASRVFVMNSDVEMPSGTLAKLEQVFDREPRVGVAAPIVMRRHAPDSVESAGISYSPATGRMRHQDRSDHGRGTMDSGGTDVDGVSGCAMLVRRDVFERAGLFAEEYFYSFEDLEFCLRAHRAGFRTVVVRDAPVLHAGSETIGAASPRRLYFGVRNHLLMASRVGSQAWPIRLARATNILALNVAHALVHSRAPIVPGLAAIGRGVRDHLKGRYGTDERPPT